MAAIDMQTELDSRYLEKERVVQRIGWVVIAALVAAALLGVFGGGLLSQGKARHATAGGELTLTYPRLGRAESNLEMELQIDAPQATGSEVTAVLSGELLQKATIKTISPEPDSQSPQGDGVAYTWQVEDWSQPLIVRFEYEARDWRVIDGRFEVSAGQERLGTLAWEQLLFP